MTGKVMKIRFLLELVGVPERISGLGIYLMNFLLCTTDIAHLQT